MDVVQQLLQTLGPDCVWLPEKAAQRLSSNWVNPEPLQCRALVLPRTTAEVAEILKICHAAQQAVVPHGGLTNIVGGVQTCADEIALSLERLNQIESIDPINHTITVQSGVVLQPLQEQLR